MEIRYTPDPGYFKMMDTQDIRDSFLVDQLFEEGEIYMVYYDVDRVIIGSAVPTTGELKLEAGEELRAEFFCQRREIGILNIGGAGSITVDGDSYSMKKLDCLYVGMGSKDITFTSENGEDPAKFYMISYPAHASYPTTHAKIADAEPVHLGSSKDCNERTIYKYIHPDGIKSCQLVMGCTLMAEGSVWNTMTAHTHERRSEVYLYFDVAPGHAVFHFMGEPDETRHVVIRDGQVTVSPSWSIHSGCGTSNYTFVWAMGGENQTFTDMDGIDIDDMQ